MDPYVYPGSSVLRNRRGIRDYERLASFEAGACVRRLLELDVKPIRGSFDVDHLCRIHRYLFQDVYPWAGKFRTVNISRAGEFPFAFPQHIESALASILAKLDGEHLAGLDLDRFAARLAYFFGELNAVHPFRDGNGRTQREFMRQLAGHHGRTVHWAGTSREEGYAASRISFQRGDNSGFESILRRTLDQDDGK